MDCQRNQWLRPERRLDAKKKSFHGHSKKRFSLLLCLCFISSSVLAALSGSLDVKAILERIKPSAEVNVEKSAEQTTGAAATPAGPTIASDDIGKQRYETTCKMCHETGLAGSPKFGDKADWAPRIAQGMDVLVKHAIEGYKTMPAKGTCMTCSDEEIKKAVEYMVSDAK